MKKQFASAHFADAYGSGRMWTQLEKQRGGRPLRISFIASQLGHWRRTYSGKCCVELESARASECIRGQVGLNPNWQRLSQLGEMLVGEKRWGGDRQLPAAIATIQIR